MWAEEVPRALAKFVQLPFHQGCGAGTGTCRNRINFGVSGQELYSEYSSGFGSGNKKMKQTAKKNFY
jgi:hypothetical protein